MKIYLVFCGDWYYPASFDDYQGTFANYDLAFNFLSEKALKAIESGQYTSGYFDWAEIIEVTELESKLVFRDNIHFFKGFKDGDLEG